MNTSVVRQLAKHLGMNDRDRWLEWLRLIDRDLTNLAINRMVWHSMTEIWRARQPPLPGSILFDVLATTYGGRRKLVELVGHVDRRKDVVGLSRLLRQLTKHPQSITREFVVGRYPWGQQWMGEGAYSTIDPNGLGHLDPLISQSRLRTSFKSG